MSNVNNSLFRPTAGSAFAVGLKRSAASAGQLASLRPAPSLRLALTPANRALMRFLRHAEWAAWNEPTATTEATALREEVARAMNAGRTESRLLLGLGVLTAGVALAGLLYSARLVQSWPEFTRALQNLLG